MEKVLFRAGDFYTTRDGRKAFISVARENGFFPYAGIITGQITASYWTLTGRYDGFKNHANDLIDHWPQKQPCRHAPIFTPSNQFFCPKCSTTFDLKQFVDCLVSNFEATTGCAATAILIGSKLLRPTIPPGFGPYYFYGTNLIKVEIVEGGGSIDVRAGSLPE